MRVVGCFLEFEDKFVILLRHSHKPDGDTWGLPGGKVEYGESDEDAMRRELEEETGYAAPYAALQYIGDYNFVSSTGKPYVYVAYKVHLKDAHQMKLEGAAHADFQWVTAGECYAKSDLIPGFHELLRLVCFIK